MAASSTKKGSRQDFSAAVSSTVARNPEKRNQEIFSMEKNEGKLETGQRGPGRPSAGRTVKITLAIPEDMISGIDCAALLHRGNRTAYINHLIAQDLKDNLGKYEAVRDMIKTANG